MSHTEKYEFKRILRYTCLFGFVIGKDPECWSGSGFYSRYIAT